MKYTYSGLALSASKVGKAHHMLSTASGYTAVCAAAVCAAPQVDAAFDYLLKSADVDLPDVRWVVTGC